MNAATITLTGPPGSGKSTAGRRAADLLAVSYVSAGALFRAEAARRGLDLAAFSRYAAAHEQVDRALDAAMLAQAGPGRLLEGRITGALLRREGRPTIYLVVTAREEVRIARLAQRDGTSPAESRRLLLEREASERDRYRRYYGVDLEREPADLVVDSSEIPAEEVAQRLATFVRARRATPEG